MSPEGQAVLCLEPSMDGPRRSGGFFYNDCLAAAAATFPGSRLQQQVRRQPWFSLQAWEGGRLPSSLILLDSLWWYVHKRPLDILSEALAGRSWGIIMHGLPDEPRGLLGDMGEASFVVVPSFWAASQVATARSSLAAVGELDIRVLYPGWDGRPDLLHGPAPRRDAGTTGNTGDPGDGRDTTDTRGRTVHIASTSNWNRAKGLVEAACILGALSRAPGCPPWVWQAAGTPDSALIAEAHSGLGPLASRLQAPGHLDPAALVRLLHGSDIFLHPSGQETFCLSVFEAALAGCRVVARAIGGVPEAIQLARLLRHHLGLPPAGVHLATASLPQALPCAQPPQPPQPDGRPAGEADSFFKALKDALAAVVEPDASSDGEPAKSSSGAEGLLHEFSWQGRLEKLLLGQSDSPLPGSPLPGSVQPGNVQPVHVEVP
jgi:hypothetical protein